jgi:subtilase family serine protease
VLAAGTSATVAANWIVPAGVSPHQVFIVVDPANAQNDRDRSNNKASIAIMKPDLTVREFYADRMGTNRSALTVRILNQGTVASSPTTVKLYLEKPWRVPLHEGSIPRLEAGGWCDIGFVWDERGNRGAVNLRAVVDERKRVPESSETNNESLIRIFGLNPASSRNWALYR